jgi:hypothetical protein
MQLITGATLELRDGRKRLFGQVVIEQIAGGSILGKFSPGPDYPAVQQLFHDFEEMVNQQVFPVADELGAAIDSLEMRLCSPQDARTWEVCDVQIMNGEDLSCRFKSGSPEQDGHGAAAQSEGHEQDREKEVKSI